ncbi:hypothetical protein F4813DRAFT_384787 [Daldinia decipiens]|uniref:uncharacterized protein n=1 Tax=Daldinia decipiens TaxID=326647 RepID=UPI0020C56E9E|nr:uncharacterized protein F4813DRAFT_384787 [Daldinia decipiens]KAI1662073.1 hypothetical protein F4813DRAFT_384787 [Daldinia decipiens]
MDSQSRTATPTPSPTTDWTPKLSPTTPDLFFIPSKQSQVKDSAPGASAESTPVSSSGESIADTAVSTPSRSQPSPERHGLASALPRVIIIYQNGCHSRLRSIYDKEDREYIYHYDRDADKPIRMAFVKGQIESLQDVHTGRFLYIRGITHKKQN